ncbi:MAG: hypothetical protein PWQ35_642 [Patescibacteria group bacterium]|nr:hypothetical protein [Patescibacteria group bacterium]
MKQTAKLKKIALTVLIVTTSLLLSACSLTGNSTLDAGIDSSVFFSSDGGNVWREATALATPGEPKSIKNLDVNRLTFDPQDNQAVYLASRNEGLYYTYDILAEGWQKAKGLPAETVNDVQVDYRNKCLIYAAIGNRLYKSVDCNRSFSQIYFDNNTTVTVNSIALDFYNPQNIYIGTSRGEVIKSIDQGESWRTIHRLENEGISQLILSPQDSRLIFVASTANKIFSFNVSSIIDSNDPISLERSFSVSNFTDLNPVLKDYDLGRTFRDFVISSDGKLFIATNQAILRSPDNGITWEKLALIPTEKDAVINSLAVDANNSNNIFYVTNTTFFRSTDGGVTWVTRKLPTSRAGSALLVDFKNPNNLYLGTVKLK